MFSLPHKGGKNKFHSVQNLPLEMCVMELKRSNDVLRSFGLFSLYVTHKEFSHIGWENWTSGFQASAFRCDLSTCFLIV